MIKRVINKVKKVLNIQYYRKLLKADMASHEISMFGTEYGGFHIATDIYDKDKGLVVYSFGIGEDLSFSEAVMDHFNCDIYAFDPTPKSIKYVESHELSSNDRFHFYPYGISDKDETGHFHLPVNEEYVSGSLHSHDGVKTEAIPVELRTFKTLVEMIESDHIDLLKMDVEGTEFDVMQGILNCDIPISQICLEVHDRYFKDGRIRLENMLKTFTDYGYSLIYVTDNFEELTFVKTGT